MSDDRLYLIHIRECIERIRKYTEDGRDAFMSNTMIQDAVVRNLQVLGESSGRLSDECRQSHPEIGWRGMKGFRNIVVHDYLGIDFKRVWDTVEHDLAPLNLAIETMLKDLEGK